MPSTRRFQAAAHNILHSMASGLAHDGTAFLAGHLGHAAARAEVATVRLDLFAGVVEPSEAAFPALVHYAQDWCARWPSIVAALGADPSAVQGIIIEATCDLARRSPAQEFLDGEQAYVVSLTCTIIDTAGATHTSEPPRNQLYLAP